MGTCRITTWRRRLAIIWLLMANVRALEFFNDLPETLKIDDEKLLNEEDPGVNLEDSSVFNLMKRINNGKYLSLSRENQRTQDEKLIKLLEKVGAKEIESKRLPNVNLTSNDVQPRRIWQATKGRREYNLGCYFKLCSYKIRFP